MRITSCISLLFTTVSAVASAAEPAFHCKYDGNQQEMNACAVRDYKAADGLLNIKYKQALSALPPEVQEQLRQEQRAWLKKRDPRCKAEAKPSEGGSIWPLEFFSCLKHVTEQRTKALEHWQAGR